MTIDTTLPSRLTLYRPQVGLVRSDPGDGGTVAIGRTELTLWFAEPVEPAASTFEVHAADGTSVDVTVRPPGPDAGRVVELCTPPLAPGTFVLDWRAVDLEDGRTSSGCVVFGVGGRPMGVVSSTTGLPKGPDLFVRWLALS